MPPCLNEVLAPPYDIVVFLLDDMRYDQLPVLEAVMSRLAPTAVQFERAYVTTPLCCPERASFLSGGWRPSQTGVLENSEPLGGVTAFPDARTMAVRMQEAGLATALYGKYLNQYDGIMPYMPPGWSEWAATGDNTEWNDFFYEYGASTPEASGETDQRRWRGYVAWWQQQYALGFLDRYGGSGLFLYLSFRAPHEPHTPAEEDAGAFGGQVYRGGAWNEEDVSDKPLWVRDRKPLDGETLETFDVAWREQNESLLAADRVMAAVIDDIAGQGRLEQTVFILTSDNGLQWGEHRLLSKGVAYEESVHIPLVISHPSFAPRAEQALVAANLDLAATVQALAGLSVEGEGRSLLPLLCGEVEAVREDVLIEGWLNELRWAGLVTQDWKFIQTGERERELYSRDQDPLEMESLHEDPAQAERMAAFTAQVGAERGLAILTDQLPAACQDLPFTARLATGGGTAPIRFSPLAMPGWLSLSEDGMLSGLPTSPGEFPVEVMAADSSLSPYSGMPQRHAVTFDLTVLSADAEACVSLKEPQDRACGCRSSGAALLLLPWMVLRRVPGYPRARRSR